MSNAPSDEGMRHAVPDDSDAALIILATPDGTTPNRPPGTAMWAVDEHADTGLIAPPERRHGPRPFSRSGRRRRS